MTGFHNRSFDDGTQLKLALFRRYIRKWLPVFLTRYGGERKNFERINIYDFFAGPGYDPGGEAGSPIIIMEEIKKFCQRNPGLKANVDVRMVFNDLKQKKIDQLEKAIQQVKCSETCCRTDCTTLPFREALHKCLPEIRRSGTANLVIMDQCGVKEVTPEVIRQLAECGTTDMLFFISSSFIRRLPELGGNIDIDTFEVKTVEYNAIHRLVCEHFRERLQGVEYYLAPFSIKKGSNIYGVIFGSRNLLGLDKFLSVCWALDSVTGQANYNIDGDLVWAGPKSLFSEYNVPRKVDLFKQDLREFIASKSPDNRDLYAFCLTHGFSPKKAGEVLKSLQEASELTVTEIATGKPARKGSFYITHDGYKDSPRVEYGVRSVP